MLSTPVPLIEGRHQGDNYFATPNSSGATVGSNSCDVGHYDYHVHAHLTIYLNGRQLAVPAAIGFKNPRFVTTTEYPDGFVSYGDCVYSLHTHDTSGKLHIEAAAPRTFTLGELFAIWSQPLSYDNIAGITGYPVVVYVNDSTNTDGTNGSASNLRRYTGDLSALPLASKREITIQIGTPVSTVPTYIWYGENNAAGAHTDMTAARVRALKARQR